MKQKNSIQKIAGYGMFCALAYVAVLLVHFLPIPKVAGFLSYDPKDAVVVIAGFLFGPAATLVISLITALLEMVTISTTGPWGFLMNFLSTAAFAFPAALVYKKMRSYQGALAGLCAGVAAQVAAMILWNYLFTPIYMKVPREVVVTMLLPVFLPFNLIKGGINAGLTLTLYKPFVTALRRAKLIPGSETEKGGSFRALRFLIGLALLVGCVLAFLFFAGIL